MIDLFDYLQNNAYPGRGLLVGSRQGQPVIAYFIMGRSANSRNRVFRKEKDILFTKAYDESKVSDPSLIIYNAVRRYGDDIIVSNGNQTDTIYDFLCEGKSFEQALQTREYEPDAPNYTPRISAIIHGDSYELSILRKKEDLCERKLFSFQMENGIGHFLSTYDHDGDPLPSFSGDPLSFPITDGFLVFADKLWDSLDAQNKISLYVKMGENEILYNRNEGD